jgi:hypothetical protein
MPRRQRSVIGVLVEARTHLLQFKALPPVASALLVQRQQHNQGQGQHTDGDAEND